MVLATLVWSVMSVFLFALVFDTLSPGPIARLYHVVSNDYDVTMVARISDIVRVYDRTGTRGYRVNYGWQETETWCISSFINAHRNYLTKEETQTFRIGDELDIMTAGHGCKSVMEPSNISRAIHYTVITYLCFFAFAFCVSLLLNWLTLSEYLRQQKIISDGNSEVKALEESLKQKVEKYRRDNASNQP